jgi:uncharacterized membrane protein
LVEEMAFVYLQAGLKPHYDSFLGRTATLNTKWYIRRTISVHNLPEWRLPLTVVTRRRLCSSCQKGKQEKPFQVLESIKSAAVGEKHTKLHSLIDVKLAELHKLVHVMAKPVGAILLSLLVVLTSLDPALAARSSGRIGGSQFSAPRMAPAPRSYEYRGGGSGFGSFYSPFPVTPIVPFGGFGVFPAPLVAPFGFGTLMMFLFVAGTVLPRLRKNLSDSEESEEDTFNAPVTICELKIGLLSSARYLQEELEALAENADTSSKEGLLYVLNETILALLRHPEYWCYASLQKNVTKWSQATAEFNRKSIEARSHTKSETVSNYNNRRMRQEKLSNENSSNGPGEYILVHLIVANEGKLFQLPSQLNSESDVREALKILSSTWSDKLQGLEIIWVPQAIDDVLTEKEMLLQHPELQRIS